METPLLLQNSDWFLFVVLLGEKEEGGRGERGKGNEGGERIEAEMPNSE